jgi:pilus assembly protein CpaF
MLKVQERFNYEQAIKTSLRQRPDWICVSEVRGSEIMYLLQSISTGTSLISTIHAESAMAIPARMLMLMPGFDLNNQSLLTMIHDCIDFGIHLEVSHDGQKVVRSIREVVQFKINENYEQEKKTIYQSDDKNKVVRYQSLFAVKKAKTPRINMDLQ